MITPTHKQHLVSRTQNPSAAKQKDDYEKHSEANVTSQSLASARRANRTKPQALVKQSQMTRNRHNNGNNELSTPSSLLVKTQHSEQPDHSMKRKAEILPKLPNSHTVVTEVND